MRYLFIFIISAIILFSYTLNDSLIKVHANIAPKLLLMDYEFENKVAQDTVCVLIVYEKDDYIGAKELQKHIEHIYENRLKSYKLFIETATYSELSDYNETVNLFYLFPASKENITLAVNKAKTSQALTFSYMSGDLKNGVMSSVLVGLKVKPILNLRAIEDNKITLRPVLLKISKIYATDGDN